MLGSRLSSSPSHQSYTVSNEVVSRDVQSGWKASVWLCGYLMTVFLCNSDFPFEKKKRQQLQAFAMQMLFLIDLTVCIMLGRNITVGLQKYLNINSVRIQNRLFILMGSLHYPALASYISDGLPVQHVLDYKISNYHLLQMI